MAIEFKCQSCQKTLRVPDEFAGRKAKCPNCQTILQVPAGDETVEPLDVQPPVKSSPDLFAGLDSLESNPRASSPDRPTFAGTNPYSSPKRHSSGRSNPGAPHRGGLILGLGIAGIVCCTIPGIAALFMGMSDLKKMKQGQMDDGGHGLTMGGTILGGVSAGLTVIGILLGVLGALLGN